MIRITAKREGFRRAGIAHSATATDHADTAFTPEQLRALESDPMLIVQRVPNPEPEQQSQDGKRRRAESDK